MEDFITILPKLLEYGALGVINIMLIFKGIPAVNNLANSISKLADKVNEMDKQVNHLEHDVHECLKDIKFELATLNRRLDDGKYNRETI